MHKIYFLILLLLPGVFSNLSAQITFERTYGGGKYEQANTALQTSDGGYLIAGISYSFSVGPSDAYLIKTDANGDSVWTKNYGGSRHEIIYSALQTSDGGYVLCGSNHGSSQLDTSNVYLLKTDANGEFLWSKSIGNIRWAWFEAYSIKQTKDGGFIIAGSMDSTYGFTGENMLLIKTDADGNIEWAKSIDAVLNQIGYDVCQTFDGGYAIVGRASIPLTPLRSLIVKVDSSGNNIWSKSFGSISGYSIARSIQQTTDSGFIVTGYADLMIDSGRDISLVKINATGDLQWAKLYGGSKNDDAYSVYQTTDDGYVVTGSTKSFGVGNADFYQIKTDADGIVQWSKTFGVIAIDRANYVQQTRDGGYIVAGSSTSFGSFYPYFLLIKTDANGNTCNSKNAATRTDNYPVIMNNVVVNVTSLNLTTTIPDSKFTPSNGKINTTCFSVGIDETTHNNKFLIYPNPTNGVFSIELPSEIESGRVEVFHINGQQVFSEAVSHTSKMTIHISNIAVGIYFVKLFDAVGYKVSRLVVIGR